MAQTAWTPTTDHIARLPEPPVEISAPDLAALTVAVEELERRNEADAAVPTGLTNTQPTVIGGVVATLPQVVMTLATAFHWFTFTGEQRVAVEGAWAVLSVGIFWWLHARVWSPASAAKLAQVAKES